jgi:hypothetical protein
MSFRLGITQYLINSGIARLEEVRDAKGGLENLYVRVSTLYLVVAIFSDPIFLARPLAGALQRKVRYWKTPR